MKIRQEHRTSNIERRTPNAWLRPGLFGVRCSMLGVRRFPAQRGSVLIIVLWVAIGLVSIALYFANTMTYELRASDNRVSGLVADQAIEGAARYVAYALQNFATNGAVPDNTQFKCAAVPVGDAKFWLIGRDPSGTPATEPYYGLVDEGGKLNLNNANTNVLSYLPGMTMDFADAIIDWRGTNGVVSLDYATLGYLPKNAPLETVDELRLVYGATVDLLAGEDVNRNGVLDTNEKDLNSNGELDPGLFEYVTVYTREPNFHADGSTLTNVNTASTREMRALLQNAGIGTAQLNTLTGTNATHRPYPGMFGFALACSRAQISSAQFAGLYDSITTTTNTYLYKRVNVNTASADVLTALFMDWNSNVEGKIVELAGHPIITYRLQSLRDQLSPTCRPLRQHHDHHEHLPLQARERQHRQRGCADGAVHGLEQQRGGKDRRTRGSPDHHISPAVSPRSAQPNLPAFTTASRPPRTLTFTSA